MAALAKCPAAASATALAAIPAQMASQLSVPTAYLTVFIKRPAELPAMPCRHYVKGRQGDNMHRSQW